MFKGLLWGCFDFLKTITRVSYRTVDLEAVVKEFISLNYSKNERFLCTKNRAFLIFGASRE